MKLRLLFNRKDSRGFTLIELLVVIAIIGVIATIIIPNLMDARNRARLAKNQGFAGNIDPIVAFSERPIPLDIRTQQVSGVINGQVVGTFPTPPYNLNILAYGLNNVTWSDDVPISGGMSINVTGNQVFNLQSQAFSTSETQLAMGMWVKPTSTNASYTWTLKSAGNEVITYIHNNTTGAQFSYYSHPCPVIIPITCIQPCTPCTTQSQSTTVGPVPLTNLLSRLKLNEWNYVLFTVKPGFLDLWINGTKVINGLITPGTISDPLLGTNSPMLTIDATDVKLYNPIYWQDYFNPANPGQLN